MADHAQTSLTVDGVSKSYGATVALHGVHLAFKSGDVIGVAGPNGAGKSTLMRIIAGEEEPDSGAVRLGAVDLDAPDRRRYVTTVHQEPQLYPTLTVEDNLVLARITGGIGRPRGGPREREILGSLGLLSYAKRKLEQCPLAIRQLVEIARAISREATVFLFDEPNSALTSEESRALFRHMDALKAAGRIVIFVSHRLDELADVAARVVVIREGRCTRTLEGASLTAHELARELSAGTPVSEATSADRESAGRMSGRGHTGRAVLKVSAWTDRRGAFKDVGLTLAVGEIVAVIGVEGSGARELVRSLGGIRHRGRGEYQRSEVSRVEFLPGDRSLSLFPHFLVEENLTARLGRPAIATVLGILRRSAVRRLARRLIHDYRIHVRSESQSIGELSGGNQQKVAAAGALASAPAVLVVEEPTRGVDVSAKKDIYRALRDFVTSGGAALVLCTEIPEVFDLADRVAVVHSGRLLRILDTSAFAQAEDLASAATLLVTEAATDTHHRREAGVIP